MRGILANARGFSANYRRNAPDDASVIGDPEHSTCGGVLALLAALLGMYAEDTTDCGSRRTTAEMHPMTQASSGTPHTKQTAGVRGIVTNARNVHSPSAITRITFGIMNIERIAIPCLSLAYPMLIYLSDSD